MENEELADEIEFSIIEYLKSEKKEKKRLIKNRVLYSQKQYYKSKVDLLRAKVEMCEEILDKIK